MKKPIVLSDREYEVMDVMWKQERELTINEISEISGNPKLTIPCIAQVVPRLLKKELIHVERFIPVNTKYARTFLPDITRQDYMEGELHRLLKKTGIRAMLSALVHINNQEENDILLDDLEKFVQEYRKQRKDGSV
ncbi:MAG: BlaI/MecI/CopY family transcriptional regulator [Lachnospiraceae bacterium]|nr:BlaI/MecI/CopY family transcriptional regulator [Lachnospiraceae bacterium]